MYSNRIQTAYLERDGSDLKIPMIQIGEGSRLVLSLYAQHGNEDASAWAFHFAKEIIGNMDLEGITYAAILANPRGVQEANRLIPKKRIDLNRDWKHFRTDEAKIIDEQIKRFLVSYDRSGIYSIDHHDAKWHMRSFFIDLPSSTGYQKEKLDMFRVFARKRLGRMKIKDTLPFLERKAENAENTFTQYMLSLGVWSVCLEVPGFVRNLSETIRTRNARTHLEIDRCLIEYAQSSSVA